MPLHLLQYNKARVYYMVDKVNDFLEWGKYGYDPNGEYEILNMLIDTEVPEGYVSPRVQINCYKNRFLFEFDDKPIQEQIDIMNRLIQMKVLFRAVYSGSKSIHMILCIDDEPLDIDEYKFVWNWLNEGFRLGGADNKCSDNSRLTRRPNVMRKVDPEKMVGNQKLIDAVQLLGVKVDINNYAVEQKLIAEPRNVITGDWRGAYAKYLDELRMKEAIEAAKIKERMEKWKREHPNETIDPEKFLERYINKHGLVWLDGHKHENAAVLWGAYKRAGFTDMEWLRTYIMNNCDSDDKTIWCNLK